MRDRPTRVAPPYITGATYHVYFGHMRFTSLVTADAAANAVVLWPDGKDWRSATENPFKSWKSLGRVTPGLTSGRARPSVPLRKPMIPDPSSTASVPCQPS